MKKKILIKNLEKILEKKNISEKSDLNDLGLDSLKILEIMAFNDLSFNSLNFYCNYDRDFKDLAIAFGVFMFGITNLNWRYKND